MHIKVFDNPLDIIEITEREENDFLIYKKIFKSEGRDKLLDFVISNRVSEVKSRKLKECQFTTHAKLAPDALMAFVNSWKKKATFDIFFQSKDKKFKSLFLSLELDALVHIFPISMSDAQEIRKVVEI